MTAQIHIITGLPGNGKTLYTLQQVEEERRKGERSVYFHGIDLDSSKLPWLPLDDPKQWHKVPSGSIVVIDEAQKLFVKRGAGAAVPEYVSAAETLRHHGIELWLITQHPMLIDSHLRKLIGDHRHLVRVFGSQAATVHRWNAVQEQCEKSRADSESSVWTYPKEVFTWYKSAEIHTIKRRLPRAFWFLLAVPIVLAACVFVMVKWYQSRLPGDAGQSVMDRRAKDTQGAGRALPLGLKVEGSPGRVVKTTAEYLQERVARLPGLPHTAAAYDEVTRPVEAPYPAACVEMRLECRCYSQQGTLLPTSRDLCASIVRTGFFVDWQTQHGQSRAGTEAARGTQPQASTERVSTGRSGPLTAQGR